MTTISEAKLQSENDRLRSAIREVLHLVNVKGLGVKCEACGSTAGRRCYGNGPMTQVHSGRDHQASERVREILMDALKIKEET